MFGAEQGFNLAVVLTSNKPSQLDPSYGRFEVKKVRFSVDDNFAYQFNNVELETHECSPEELGLSGGSEQHKFWPINKQQERFLNLESAKNFLCVDQSELAV